MVLYKYSSFPFIFFTVWPLAILPVQGGIQEEWQSKYPGLAPFLRGVYYPAQREIYAGPYCTVSPLDGSEYKPVQTNSENSPSATSKFGGRPQFEQELIRR